MHQSFIEMEQWYEYIAIIHNNYCDVYLSLSLKMCSHPCYISTLSPPLNSITILLITIFSHILSNLLIYPHSSSPISPPFTSISPLHPPLHPQSALELIIAANYRPMRLWERLFGRKILHEGHEGMVGALSSLNVLYIFWPMMR